MYFKNIKIKGYGPIVNFDYSFKYDNDLPRPLVVVGKNGSGKSLLLVNIVDSLIETKRKLFDGGILEIKGDNFYKVGKQAYISHGEKYSIVDISINYTDKDINYCDVMSHKTKDNIDEIEKINNNIDKRQLTETGYSKKVNLNGVSVDDFNSSCYLFFPINRYYNPSWYNKNNVDSDTNYTEKIVNKSSTNIIKENVSENIKEWMYRLFSARYMISLSGNQFTILNDNLQSMIVSILRTIKGNDSDVPLLNRKRNDVTLLVNRKSIELESLSSGEMMLFSIFVSIIKEYDINNVINSFDDIKGVCIIDEADLNLHVELQKDVFPKLMKLFKNVQFIITTHSPFLLSGLKNAYENNIDFLLMPTGSLLNDLYDFSEVIEALKAFGPEVDSIIKKFEVVKHEVEKLYDESKILVLTEGKTDKKYIEKAFEILSRDHNNIKLHYIEGDTNLKSLIESQKQLGVNSKKIIAIFDRDNPEIYSKYFSDANNIKEIVKEKVYAFCLPIPSNRIGEQEISIEHYFTDEELNISFDGRKLFQKKEFDELGIHNDRKKFCRYLSRPSKHSGIYVLSGSDDKKVIDIDSKENVSMTKDDYCENVINKNRGFENVDFKEFTLIFEKIDECIFKIK